MSQGEGKRDPLVERIVNNRLDEFQAWPVKPLKLECETYDKYQNTTGITIDQLEDNGEVVQIKEGGLPFVARPDVSSVSEEPIFEKTQQIYEVFKNNGYIANLAMYVMLCQIFDEIRGNIDLDVLPERAFYYLLHDTDGRIPDGLIRIPHEYVPVEVYNGADYISSRSDKYRQLMAYASVENDEVNSHPMLINRRSTDRVKTAIRDKNGMVVDTDCFLVSESIYSEHADVIDFFYLDDIMCEVPPLTAADGDPLTGEEYDRLEGDQESARRLRPPSEMTTDVEDLPKQYRWRVRGGVQLLYVNSIYRRAQEPIRRDACFVIQSIYNLLLRGGGLTRGDALSKGWDEAATRYRRIRKPDYPKDAIMEETETLLEKLRNERIITEANGKIHARKSEHPQQSFG